jgi:hypothetical protein
MVYGDKKSYATNQVKQLFKKLNLKQNQESINFVMNTISKLNNLHPAKIFSETEIKQDLNHPSGVVDFFLHKKENFFSIKELVKLLNKNKLIIKNFANGRIKPLTKFFTDAPLHIKEKINSLPVEDKLEISQILNWNDRKIDLICCKSKNKKNSIIYNKINLEKIYTYQYHGVEYKIDGTNIKITDKINNGFFNLDFRNNKFKFSEILDGKKILPEITTNFDKIERKNFNDKIIFMIENSILDFSYHPIVDYKKYYSIQTN